MRNLPKIELHCHLDGSVRIETIIDIAKKDGIYLPSYNKDDIKTLVQVSKDCKSLNEYLDKFDLANQVMQTKKNIERITFELLEDAQSENIKYMEIRFSPILHTKHGLSIKEVIKSVINGIEKAERKYEIKANIILSCMRNMSIDKGIMIVEEGKEFLGRGVIAIDLAGPEIEGFCKEFKPLVDLARKYGYKITIHAGEASGPQNVIDAINILGASRIGHGVRIKDIKDIYNLIKEKNVCLEMCPTSNIQTKAIDDIKNYPLYEFLREGIGITINTDNRTVSNIDLTNEMELIFNKFNIDLNKYKDIYLSAVDSSFSNEDTKKWLKNFL